MMRLVFIVCSRLVFCSRVFVVSRGVAVLEMIWWLGLVLVVFVILYCRRRCFYC